MKITYSIIAAVAISFAATAQEPAKTLASTMDVFVFPTTGQDAGQQSTDEVSCYDWAAANTGNDPFDLAKQAESDDELAAAEMQAAESAGQGSGGRSALRGAAAGAIIADVSGGDTSEGAAMGAAAGVIRNRRQGRAAQAQATEQAEGKAEVREETTAEDLENFKKAFSVCLEAKEYMVKF